MKSENGSVRQAFLAARAASAACAKAADECECETHKCEHVFARQAAEAAFSEAAAALIASPEACEYTLRDAESGVTKTIMAASDKVAWQEAREWTENGDYDLTETIWVRVYVARETDPGYESGRGSDDEETLTVTLEPPEPPCGDDGGDHDWQSPHAIVGGIKENPGVQGHGGGVLIHEACMRCGCARHTDTWAQNPSTGEQGLRSVAYEPHAHEEISTYAEAL
jgi:hypothetical protein